MFIDTNVICCEQSHISSEKQGTVGLLKKSLIEPGRVGSAHAGYFYHLVFF
jgi:hypothetical protein